MNKYTAISFFEIDLTLRGKLKEDFNSNAKFMKINTQTYMTFETEKSDEEIKTILHSYNIFLFFKQNEHNFDLSGVSSELNDYIKTTTEHEYDNKEIIIFEDEYELMFFNSINNEMRMLLGDENTEDDPLHDSIKITLSKSTKELTPIQYVSGLTESDKNEEIQKIIDKLPNISDFEREVYILLSNDE